LNYWSSRLQAAGQRIVQVPILLAVFRDCKIEDAAVIRGAQIKLGILKIIPEKSESQQIHNIKNNQPKTRTAQILEK
jgi:hypothetical protein